MSEWMRREDGQVDARTVQEKVSLRSGPQAEVVL